MNAQHNIYQWAGGRGGFKAYLFTPRFTASESLVFISPQICELSWQNCKLTVFCVANFHGGLQHKRDERCATHEQGHQEAIPDALCVVAYLRACALPLRCARAFLDQFVLKHEFIKQLHWRYTDERIEVV
jgi:hypothetical protein